MLVTSTLLDTLRSFIKGNDIFTLCVMTVNISYVLPDILVLVYTVRLR